MLVFDLDDTLYLERDFAFSGYNWLNGWVHEKTGAEGFGQQCQAAYNAGERRRIFNVACAQTGLDATDAFIQDLITKYRSHPPSISLCKDAERFLTNADQPMGLITDGPEKMQRNKIAALDLDRFIAHIRPTGAWPDGYGKPHPRAYEEMELAAQNPRRMVYVADNPAKDFITPNARGWRTVQILRPGAVHDPIPPSSKHAAYATVTSLGQLTEVLSDL